MSLFLLSSHPQVLVHGTAEATDSLADFCRSTSGMVQGKVFTPKVGELVDATTESHIFQVPYADALVGWFLGCTKALPITFTKKK